MVIDDEENMENTSPIKNKPNIPITQPSNEKEKINFIKNQIKSSSANAKVNNIKPSPVKITKPNLQNNNNKNRSTPMKKEVKIA
jgi:hypothetical protein